MKFVYLLALFALAFAYVNAAAVGNDAGAGAGSGAATNDAAACDPDGNGKPDCTADAGGNHRNFWDPTHYWECQNGVAVSVECPNNTGYLSSAKACVDWDEWEWVPPCPSSE